MARNLQVQIFDCMESANDAEYLRRAQQSPQERMKEFAVLQERVFGKDWTQKKIEKVVSFEEVDW